jgi:hypothetical protein
MNSATILRHTIPTTSEVVKVHNFDDLVQCVADIIVS